jgi:hypothetical protein
MPQIQRADIDKVRNALVLNECGPALSLLVEMLNDAESAWRNEALLQVARLRRIDSDERKGLIDRDKASLERLRLQYAVTDFLDELWARAGQKSGREERGASGTATSIEGESQIEARPMSKIFISYAREDKGVAVKLANLLEVRGYEVWWDHCLIAGQDYREMIKEQLLAADKVIVLWSSHSIRSAFVIDEARFGNEAGKLIPIVIDVSDPPMGFGHLHTVLSKDIQSEIEPIVAALENRAPDKRSKT